ncbi:MAG: hypothetical protein EAY68_08670 [Bacteroidetes bacterium]|nr:MAG: hypothetical protein EAY68_08670 [Bacteroidota bacterium]
MGNTISVHTLLLKKYPVYGFDQELIDMIGEAERGFKMLIWGASGNGKSTFAAILLKKLTKYGKVYYNSIEQGEGKSIQDLANHTKLGECEKGSFMFGDRDSYDEMVKKLKSNRCKFVVIDSLQYINLTVEHYKKLITEFPNKSFIIISWEGSGGNPKGEYAKSIRYMCDIKTYIKKGVALTDSRFGATMPWHIPGVYDKFHKNRQLSPLGF